MTGNGESKFDSGEGALEIATTFKDGSRHATYPMTAQIVEIVTRTKAVVEVSASNCTGYHRRMSALV